MPLRMRLPYHFYLRLVFLSMKRLSSSVFLMRVIDSINRAKPWQMFKRERLHLGLTAFPSVISVVSQLRYWDRDLRAL